jgi:hypothetical protein
MLSSADEVLSSALLTLLAILMTSLSRTVRHKNTAVPSLADILAIITTVECTAVTNPVIRPWTRLEGAVGRAAIDRPA